ncbi:MAG: iron-sulfur cluster assembly protein [Archaeoglobi archaeon]|uniref:iron-sulfur cluster assembly protein n=1 Tax=Geoglobus ahangari TaxID=113653 RepID=UPI00069A5D51|nr:iron-sulfur cluster assembly protein [Geoglobus ahangari]NOY11118.1 iron-sulfur cluster assembly protein [Archaeoglobi archaeon]
MDEQQVIEKLRKVMDPHTRQSVWDMGLIEDLKVEGNEVNLTFRPSSPFCPIGQQLAFAIKRSVEELGVKAKVKVVGYVKEKELNEVLGK